MYIPEVGDYVIWDRPNGDIESGWVYFKGDPVDNGRRSKEGWKPISQYITIETGVREKPECYLDESSVRVKTMDTKKFFENLALTRLVNPIVLATFYSQLLSGIPHKLGHSLEF